MLEEPPVARREGFRAALTNSESGKAAGLAAATLANNAIQLVFTVVFTRLLRATDYGTLAALVSAFLILLVVGQSVQMAAAREAALDSLGHPELLRATLHDWTRKLLIAFVAVTAASAVLREPLAALIGVDDVPWAAAAIPPTGVLWMLLCLQRGALQGLREYRPVGVSIVGEGFLRLVFALVLVGAGMGVTGALLGTPLSFVVVGLWLERELVAASDRWARTTAAAHPAVAGRQRIGADPRALHARLAAEHRRHPRQAPAHRRRGGLLRAAAVAAKAVVWVAIGIGLHLLPEATRRAAAGLDPRRVLLRALAMAGLVAAPALVVFAVAPELLLRLAFGPDLTGASDALLVLGAAMTLLAFTYLTVQYMVALGETSFLWVLGAVALAEPFVLTTSGQGIVSFAWIVFGVQFVAAASVLALAVRARRRSLTTV